MIYVIMNVVTREFLDNEELPVSNIEDAYHWTDEELVENFIENILPNPEEYVVRTIKVIYEFVN